MDDSNPSLHNSVRLLIAFCGVMFLLGRPIAIQAGTPSHYFAPSPKTTGSFPAELGQPPIPLRQELPLGGPSVRNVAAFREDSSPSDSDGGTAIVFDRFHDGSRNGDFDDRLRKLEEEWAKQQKQLAETVARKKTKPTYKLNGRIHADYWTFPRASPGIGFFEHPDPALANFGVDPEDRFGFRRVRIELKGDALKTMYWKLQVDFAEPETASIKDVFIGFRELPGNQRLQIGHQKRPLGLDHLNSSKNNVFIERPFVIDAFNEDSRRLGLLIQRSSEDERYLWQYGVFNMENLATDGKYLGDSYQLSGNVRLASSPWYDEASGGRNYFHWAVAGMLAHPDGDADAADSNSNEARFRTRPEGRSSSRWLSTGRIAGANWYETLGLESILNVGPLQIVGEYQHNWLQRDGATPLQPDLQFHGWYLYANYLLTGEHIPYTRSSGTIGRLKPFRNFGLIDRCCGGSGRGWGAWGVGVRYSVIDLSDGDIQGGEGESWTAALNWYWTPYARLQFNAIYGEIDNHAPVGGFTSGHYTILGTRAMVEF